MAAIGAARRGKPHPPLGVLLAQLPQIFGEPERRAATAVSQLMARSGQPRGVRGPSASAAARRAARPR